MEKIKLHQITDGPLELIPYRPPTIARDELEYRYKLALYLHKIGVCESYLFEDRYFKNYYLKENDDKLPRLMILYRLIYYNVNREEYYDYLDCYPLSSTCRYLARKSVPLHDYIPSRFESGKFSIDNLIEMVEGYNMRDKIIDDLGSISEYVLSNNGGDATDLIRLIDSVNIRPCNLMLPFARYGNYDAFKYITTRSLEVISIRSMLNGAYYISSKRLDTVIGYYLKDGKSIEHLLIVSSITNNNDDNVIYHILKHYQPDLEVVLREAHKHSFVVEIIESLIENNV